MDELLEIETAQQMNREEAAAFLQKVSDSLARHNELEFVHDGTRFRIKVPDEVLVEIELEVETDGASLEIELSW